MFLSERTALHMAGKLGVAVDTVWSGLREQNDKVSCMIFEDGIPSPTYIALTYEAIETDKLLEFVSTSQAGAVVLFLGTVREITGDKVTESLEYESYGEMALSQMEILAEAARLRWPIVKVAIEHRLGHLALGECCVAIAVSCPHRKEAFSAAQYLIDELKIRVPIWKKEHWAGGTSEWIHPAPPERE